MKSGTQEVLQSPQTGTPLRVLILEDSPDDVELLLLQLKHSGFDVVSTQVEEKAQFRAAASQGDFDVVFADTICRIGQASMLSVSYATSARTFRFCWSRERLEKRRRWNASKRAPPTTF